MSATKRLAEFATKTLYADLPYEVISRGKERIFDILGCMIAGCKEEIAQIMLEHLKRMGAKPEATIVGLGYKTSTPSAALLNGILGHVLDFDDAQDSLLGHPSTVIFPAVLSLGENVNASGEAILEAFMVGFEVACKVGKVVNPQLYDNGWHATSVIGILGATVAAGKLLNLGVSEMTSALGIAASQACGLRENFGTMMKPFHAGKAAESGVVSAHLAKSGFTASQEILEGKRGFCSCFSDKHILDDVIKNLGNPFDIVFPGVHTKPYPSCLSTHPIIEATLTLLNSHDIRPEDIESVECEIGPRASDMLIHSNPKTGLEGKFSSEYVITISLLEKRVSLEHFTDKNVQDSRVQEIIRKIRTVVNPDMQELLPPSTVTIRLKDKREYSARVDVPLGSAERPMPLNQIIAKYINCAESFIDKDKVRASLDKILNFEKLAHVDELFPLIVKNRDQE